MLFTRTQCSFNVPSLMMLLQVGLGPHNNLWWQLSLVRPSIFRPTVSKHGMELKTMPPAGKSPLNWHLFFLIYTVGLFILDHNSHISWWISTLCAPIKTGRNTLLGNYKICNVTTSVSLHYLRKFKNTQNSRTVGDRFLLYVRSNPSCATFAESRLAFIVSSSC